MKEEIQEDMFKVLELLMLENERLALREIRKCHLLFRREDLLRVGTVCLRKISSPGN